MALESVDYSEEKACQILNIVRKEEEEEIVNKPKTIENESQIQPKTLEQPITNNRRLVTFFILFLFSDLNFSFLRKLTRNIYR